MPYVLDSLLISAFTLDGALLLPGPRIPLGVPQGLGLGVREVFAISGVARPL